MLPDRVSNPGPLTYESGALPIALRGPAVKKGGVGLSKIQVVTLSREAALSVSFLHLFYK